VALAATLAASSAGKVLTNWPLAGLKIDKVLMRCSLWKKLKLE